MITGRTETQVKAYTEDASESKTKMQGQRRKENLKGIARNYERGKYFSLQIVIEKGERLLRESEATTKARQKAIKKRKYIVRLRSFFPSQSPFTPLQPF